MPTLRIEKYLPAISLFLFVTSLTQPAFYMGEVQTGHITTFSAHKVLVLGWLGPLSGHFAWFANPAYLIAFAIIKARPAYSRFLAYAAFVLCLSFLLYPRLLVNEGGTTAPIVEYGIGFYLWAWAIAVFAYSQARKYRLKTVEHNSSLRWAFYLNYVPLFAIGIIPIFILKTVIVENSQFSLERERSRILADICPTAKADYLEVPRPMKGVFVDPDWNMGVGTDSIVRGAKGLGISLVHHGKLEFYETKSDMKNDKLLKRYYRNRFSEKEAELTATMASEYSVITKSLTDGLRKELGIYGYQVLVTDNITNRAIAEARFFGSYADDKKCIPNPKKNRFEIDDFANRALHFYPTDAVTDRDGAPSGRVCFKVINAPSGSRVWVEAGTPPNLAAKRIRSNPLGHNTECVNYGLSMSPLQIQVYSATDSNSKSNFVNDSEMSNPLTIQIVSDHQTCIGIFPDKLSPPSKWSTEIVGCDGF